VFVGVSICWYFLILVRYCAPDCVRGMNIKYSRSSMQSFLWRVSVASQKV
jgi:hypothetical protein